MLHGICISKQCNAILAATISVLVTSDVLAQSLEYTQSDTGLNQIALGYPVPLPIDSITPVDGFRTYDSLDLRHQQLTEQYPEATRSQLGSTVEGRPIWGYQLSDADLVKSAGGAEAAALINGGIHAREWQSPESVTGFMENLLERGQDNHIHQYLLENLNLVIIPVLNIDGFLQTQRYPALVTNSEQIPREGRMRRKNMNGVDTDLNTTSDNLLGVDLNRNNAPWWATSERSSSVGSSIVYHGTVAASEPEIQALQAGAVLAGEQQLAFYMDVHSFTQIYFAPNTGLNSRDNQAREVAAVMRRANNFKYDYGPGPAGGGIGSTDEYFAYTYQIPSYTLEIEPDNSSQEYGGNGVSHDGFILPESEVDRMRAETSEATFAGLYTITDIPMLSGLEIIDADNSVSFHLDWQSNEAGRELLRLVESTLLPDTAYTLRLSFNKPMRAIANDNFFSGFGNVSQPEVQLRYILNDTESIQELSSDDGAWATDQSQYRQYKTDVFEMPFTTPEDLDWDSLQGLGFDINTTDMTGNRLDTDPSSYAVWQNGAWQNYEGTNNLGGNDTNMVLLAFQDIDQTPEPTTPPPSPPTTPPTPTVNNSGGGGSTGFLLAVILCGLWYRNRKYLRYFRFA